MIIIDRRHSTYDNACIAFYKVMDLDTGSEASSRGSLTSFYGFEHSDVNMAELEITSGNPVPKILPFRVDKLEILSEPLKQKAIDLLDALPGYKVGQFMLTFDRVERTISLNDVCTPTDPRPLSEVYLSPNFMCVDSGEVQGGVAGSSSGLSRTLSPLRGFSASAGPLESRPISTQFSPGVAVNYNVNTNVSNSGGCPKVPGFTSSLEVHGPVQPLVPEAVHRPIQTMTAVKPLDDSEVASKYIDVINVPSKVNHNVEESVPGNDLNNNATGRQMFLESSFTPKRKSQSEMGIGAYKRSSGYGLKAAYLDFELPSTSNDRPRPQSTYKGLAKEADASGSFDLIMNRMGLLEAKFDRMSEIHCDNNLKISEHLASMKEHFSAKFARLGQEAPASTCPFNLSIPTQELWNGKFEDSDFYFIDNLGFCFCLDVQSDTFDFVEVIYDVSSFSNLPRSTYLSSVLKRLKYPADWLPLYLTRSLGSGSIEISAIEDPGDLSQVLYPWTLSVFDLSPPSESNTNVNVITAKSADCAINTGTVKSGSVGATLVNSNSDSKGTADASTGSTITSSDNSNTSNANVNKAGSGTLAKNASHGSDRAKAAQAMLDILNSAKDRAVNNLDQTSASIWQNMSQYLVPELSNESSSRNWPLVVETLKKMDPNCFTEVASAFPESAKDKPPAPELRFTESPFFSEYLKFFSGFLDGSVSLSGKRSSDGTPLATGKFFPPVLGSNAKFYKHGTSSHLNLFPPTEFKDFVSPALRDSIDKSGLFFNNTLSKQFGNSVSLLREIASTQKRILSVITADPNFDKLEGPAKAAAVSLDRAIADGMMAASSMHGNLVLASRDKYIKQIQPGILAHKSGLDTRLRSAPIDNSVFPSSVYPLLEEAKKGCPKPRAFRKNAFKKAGTSFTKPMLQQSFQSSAHPSQNVGSSGFSGAGNSNPFSVQNNSFRGARGGSKSRFRGKSRGFRGRF